MPLEGQGVEATLGKQSGQRLAVLAGLAATLVVERNVLAPLIAALGIPGRFTMPDEVDFRPDQGCHDIPAPLSWRVLRGRVAASDYSLASGVSLSSSFMPTMLKPAST
ncbi:hypothetical protein D3C87_1700330 [compost metagenome]